MASPRSVLIDLAKVAVAYLLLWRAAAYAASLVELSTDLLAVSEFLLDALFLGTAALALGPSWLGPPGIRWLLPNQSKRRDVLLGAVVGLFALLTVTGCFALVEAAGVEVSTHPDLLSIAPASTTAKIAIVSILGIIDPVAEELFFRGLLQSWAMNRFGTVRGAIGSCVAFAAVHLDPVQLLVALYVGTILSALFARWRSLVSTIAAHATFNVVSLASWLIP